MRVEDLPSPGPLSLGINLRTVAARAISSVEVIASVTPGGKTSSANLLHTFFTACATAIATLRDTVLPTVATRVRTAASTAVITLSEDLDPASVPANSAFVFTPARTVTAVAVSGRKVTITATGAIVGDSVAYTKPGTNMLKDLAGNEVANFSGALAAP